MAGTQQPGRRAQPGLCGARISARAADRADARPRRCAAGERLPWLPRDAAGATRAALPDQRRGGLRRLPRPGVGLDRQPCRRGRHAWRQCEGGPIRARTARRARQCLPRLPSGQRQARPVRLAPDDGGGPSAHQFRARSLLDLPAALERGRGLCGAQGNGRAAALLGGGAGGSGGAHRRAVRETGAGE